MPRARLETSDEDPVPRLDHKSQHEEEKQEDGRNLDVLGDG